MEGDRQRRRDLDQVSGSVYGVDVRGRLPAAFRPYLHPGAAPEPALSLEVAYRPADDLSESEAIWSSESEGPDARVRVDLFTLPTGFGLDVSGGPRGRFTCSDRAIQVEWSGSPDEAAHSFFSHALPLWLETRGVPVLHGSAVTLEGLAVAFLGQSGTGKSLLCAELLRLECGFLTDDGVALRRDRSEAWRCAPGPPLLRLWPSGLRGRLEIDPGPLPRVQGTLDKRQVRLDAEAPGAPAGRPLAALYLLRRRPEPGGSVRVEPCGPREALTRLIEHGVAVGPAAALGLSGPRLRLLAEIAERVPMRALSYPSGGSAAAEIREAIARDVRGSDASR